MNTMKPISWTIREASLELEVSRDTITAGLRRQDITVKRGARYSTREIFAAVAGDYRSERTRQARARADLLELEKRVKAGDLVPMAAAEATLTRALLPVRQRLLALPSELSARTNPTDPVHAEQMLDAWVQRSLVMIQAEIERCAAPVTPKRKARK